MLYKNSKFIIFILLISLITGCGIKPSKLSPPEDSDKSEYPRVYPDISDEKN